MAWFLAASEAARTAADLEDGLLPVAVALVVVSFLYAAIAAWRVTDKADH